MANEKEQKKGDAPVFDRRLKDLRVACWKNKSAEGRTWFHVTLSRAFRKGDEMCEAPGSLNGLPDIALAIAGLEAAKHFIEEQQLALAA